MNKADAAIFELRARAAQNPDDRVGLFAAVRCANHQGPLWAGHVMKSAQRLQFCSGTSLGTFAGQDAHDD